ncbi:MAG: serpin family protein [Chitinophagaceae bacterium]|jgi:serpin B|nr:serpin family protein [Chitinophagaceae bacterium]
MNTLKSTIYFVGVCWFFLGCSKNNQQDPLKPSPVMNINVSAQVAQNTSNFAFNFFNALQQTQPKTDNIFVSPLSLHIDAGMLLNGANGNTYTQLQNALNLNGLSVDDINQAYQTLLQDLPKADNLVDLTLANSMWYKNNFPVLPDYSNTLTNYFQSAAYPSAFGKPAVDSINKWASDNTKGKINHVIDAPIDPDAVMFLLNALYFKGNWASQFDKSNTKPQTFTMEDGSTKQVQMMLQQNAFVYTSNTTYSAIRLPYGNGQFSMTILLPTQGNKIEDVINNFTANDWNAFQQDTSRITVQVGLPRFTIPLYKVDLIPVMKSMGVTDVFSDQLANLSKINTAAVNGLLFVYLMQQFTYLNVDEVGTEAAAVTIIGTATTSISATPSFICDHPFGIIISENTSNTILFMGRIMNPDSQ